MKIRKTKSFGKTSIILYLSIYIFMVYPLASAFMEAPAVAPDTRTRIEAHATYLPYNYSVFQKQIPQETEKPEITEVTPEEVIVEQIETKQVPEPQKPQPYAPADAPSPEKEISVDKSSLKLSDFVLNIIETYEIGNYPYLLNNDYSNYNGVTTNIVYRDGVLAKAHPSGSKASHCVGITFEVFFKAMGERNRALGIDSDDFNGMTWAELHDFMLMWYVAGPKVSNNCAAAVEKYGLGRRITNFEEAEAGDFIDFSRENGTGHAAIFLNWIRENGQIVGFEYWSSQPSTKGINYNTEYFNVRKENSTKYGNVLTNHFYIARIYAVSDYN
jgi:hypothetical protein